MSSTSTKVFILEVMGRHTGWIAAAAGLASGQRWSQGRPAYPPHVILFPERAFNPESFLLEVKHCVQAFGFCVVVASEGIRDASGAFISQTNHQDAFGHVQLGGVAPKLAAMVREKLGLKPHWAVLDYLQRSARHIASQTDLDQAYAVGVKAIEMALQGCTDQMLTIQRISDTPYRWSVGAVPLEAVANQERRLPDEWIHERGFHINPACFAYLHPLIQGEAYPPYREGLPDYHNQMTYPKVARRLPEWSVSS